MRKKKKVVKDYEEMEVTQRKRGGWERLMEMKTAYTSIKTK